jgi:hypothetical protein
MEFFRLSASLKVVMAYRILFLAFLNHFLSHIILELYNFLHLEATKKFLEIKLFAKMEYAIKKTLSNTLSHISKVDFLP